MSASRSELQETGSLIARAVVAAIASCALLPDAAWASDEANRILGEAVGVCRDFGGGTFSTSTLAVKSVDLTGDGMADEVVDEGAFQCSSGPVFCGSGGCFIHAVVNDQRFSWLAYGWRVVDTNSTPILLLNIHGSGCSSVGADACYEALVWNGTRFLSVAGLGIAP